MSWAAFLENIYVKGRRYLKSLTYKNGGYEK